MLGLGWIELGEVAVAGGGWNGVEEQGYVDAAGS